MEKSIINDDFFAIYKQLLSEGKIEIFEYDSPNVDIKKCFLKKWKELKGSDYIGDEETIYIGEKGNDGKFYECYEDFFYRLEGEKDSAQERLIKEVLKIT